MSQPNLTVAVWLQHDEASIFTFTAAHQAQLENLIPGVRCIRCENEKDFISALKQAEAAAVWQFKQAYFELAPKLRLVMTPAAGRDYFHVTAPAGVRLCYGQFHGRIMSETAVAMVLSASRGILPLLLSELRTQPWPRTELARTIRPLAGSHVVILGFGRIGRSIGEKLKTFGVKITGVRRRASAPPAWFEAKDRVVPLRSLDAILPEADHLIICLPSGKETDQLLDAQRLHLLPSHAWLYNLGRGNVLDETALANSLQSGHLGGACLDVFSREPLPADNPLRQAPRLLIMPHASAFSPTYLEYFVEELADELKNLQNHA